jgi:hypothetical protein
MTHFGAELRRLGSKAASMEEAADRVVRSLYDSLRAGSGEARACALVRVFVTHPFGQLSGDLQRFALDVLGADDAPARMKCLTLLASAGDEPAWNSRRSSAGHKALPLPSEEVVGRSPMIARLITQLGVEIGSLIGSDGNLVMDTQQHTFNVFHVADAVGSPYIPAQREFVVPHGIRSVLGFGGLLPPGELFATILFSRAPIPREVANLFKTLALNVKVALLPYAGARVFA